MKYFCRLGEGKRVKGDGWINIQKKFQGVIYPENNLCSISPGPVKICAK